MVARAKKYVNQDVSERLGNLLRSKRKELNYSLDDMVQMTQFPKSTILKIEKGIANNLHYYVAYAQAVALSILPVEMPLKPIFELSPERKKRLFLTAKIKELLQREDFFSTHRSVSEVLGELRSIYHIEPSKSHSTSVSQILLNLIEDGLLDLAGKQGRNNLYKLRKR